MPTRPLRPSVATSAQATGPGVWLPGAAALPVLILTGAVVAGLAMVALLGFLISTPGPPATPVESLGGRVTAGAFAPPKPEVLSASANPLGTGSDARVTKTARTVSLRPRRTRPDRSRARTHSHPLRHAESGIKEQPVCGRCLLHARDLGSGQPHRCARHPKPRDHDLDTAAHLDVDAPAVDEHGESHLELRARQRSTSLESKAFSALALLRTPDPKRKRTP